MKLITKDLMHRLISNGMKQSPVRGTPAEIDFEPVVKLFTPDGSATWLLTEVEPDQPDIAFGLCDLGMGFPDALGVVAVAPDDRGAGMFRSQCADQGDRVMGDVSGKVDHIASGDRVHGQR